VETGNEEKRKGNEKENESSASLVQTSKRAGNEQLRKWKRRGVFSLPFVSFHDHIFAALFSEPPVALRFLGPL
jgi:hypothetical protein